MARVSQEHLDARRRQILDGAARCFTRNGFHATSMQDVLREADLSAGAVYRYFRGKEELIGAIVTEVLDSIRASFEAAARQSPPPPPDQLIADVMSDVLGSRTEGFPGLIVQVWAETLRNEALAAVLSSGFVQVREAWVNIVRVYQDAGTMDPDVPADDVARVMIATAQGFAAQQALFGEVPVDVLRSGLRGLMSMDPQRAS